ncbi:polysaccharide pyruvyl transferase family protein [Bifidobacterium biavatii]|uniref:Polysaccharide pyruvyl transferase n=1 Tax=Bifidobacterium biavatii DSM 23969 TaxID=1437608 RepID=A0A086ZT01_9BIFI|nr:polysaccharide pyruvyl transferase family protein [Bifidobacterium biavatii]KFI49651.1 polysaccharide pyruvyl transferase [Bifidobacterium biavatii DSM 23969]
MPDTYVIVPGCSDLNRGDQALAWETREVAQDAGFFGKYAIVSETNEPVAQTRRQGFDSIAPVLEHPSRLFKNKQNMEYTKALKIKWGIVAIGDFLRSLMLLSPITRGVGLALSSKRNRESFNAIKSAKAVFMKGGGLIQTYGGLSSTYSAYFWVFHMKLAISLGIPVYIMPNSFGPFKGPFVKSIVRSLFKQCRLVTAREEFSQEMVRKDLGISIPLFPDLAFYLKRSQRMSKKDVAKHYDLPNDRKWVAITARPYRFPGSDNPEADYVHYKESLIEFAEWLYASGYMPVFIEHTLAVNAHENDGACIREIIQHLNPMHYRFISDPDLNCRDLKAIYSFCDYTVGTRFHSVVFSLSEGTPSIAISYVGNKATGIMHDIGLSDYVLSIRDISSDSLKSRFSKLVNNEEAVLKKVDDYKTRCTARRQQLITLMQQA